MDPESQRLAAAEELVGHNFADRTLLQKALTHPSSSDGLDAYEDYERLEFLGDAVLSLVVVEEVFRRFPDLPEGVMTKMKIALVAGTTLSAVADEMGLASLIRVGLSEMGTDRRGLSSALENVYEALVGALYLDAGLPTVRHFVLRTLGDRFGQDAIEGLEHPKSVLQEILQARRTVPVYLVTAVNGPPHDCVFEVAVSVDGEEIGVGQGRSKKEAESAAASDALETLGRR